MPGRADPRGAPEPPRPHATDLQAHAASATSAATTARRTASTTPTSRPPGTPAPRSARATRCGPSPRARAAATPSSTSSTTPSGEGVETDTRALPRHTLTADRLILSAGALGTPFLMLRNRAALPAVSRALGTRFCGNGDLLTFARQCMEAGPGGVRRPRDLDASHAPVITSAIRVPDALDGGEGRGFYLEDAGQPAFASWLLQVLDAPRSVWESLPRLARLAGDFVTHRDTRRRRGALRAARRLRGVGRVPAAARHGPRRPRGHDGAGRSRPPRGRVAQERHVAAVLRPRARAVRAGGRARSAARSSTTRSGC